MKPWLSRSRVVALVVLAAAAVGIGVLSRNSLSSNPPVPRIVPLAESLGPVTVTAKDGTKVDLTALRGKTVVLHFWATWCPPCVDEMPGLVAYAKELSGDPSVQLVTVSVDESFEIVTAFLEKHGGTELPVLLDAKREAAGRLGTLKFPETYVISPDGFIVTLVQGAMQWESPEVRKQLGAWTRKATASAAKTPS